MDKITMRAVRAYNYYEARRASLIQWYGRALADQRGSDEIPWKLIFMIGGAAIAVGILVWAGAWVKGQLAAVPNAPAY